MAYHKPFDFLLHIGGFVNSQSARGETVCLRDQHTGIRMVVSLESGCYDSGSKDSVAILLGLSFLLLAGKTANWSYCISRSCRLNGQTGFE
jgi:hypothetical protein